jgi:hypothetical protein
VANTSDGLFEDSQEVFLYEPPKRLTELKNRIQRIKLLGDVECGLLYRLLGLLFGCEARRNLISNRAMRLNYLINIGVFRRKYFMPQFTARSMKTYDTDKFETGMIDFYEQLFRSLKDKPVKFLEIGVSHGGSLQYFSDFFKNGQIFGIDIIGPTLPLKDNAQFMLMDQNDKCGLKKFAEEKGPFDVIVDDASHRRKETSNCFEVLWKYVKPNGVYVIEDWGAGYSQVSSRGMVEFVAEILLHKKDLGIKAIQLKDSNWHSFVVFGK